jgi:hypothetical protein
VCTIVDKLVAVLCLHYQQVYDSLSYYFIAFCMHANTATVTVRVSTSCNSNCTSFMYVHCHSATSCTHCQLTILTHVSCLFFPVTQHRTTRLHGVAQAAAVEISDVPIAARTEPKQTTAKSSSSSSSNSSGDDAAASTANQPTVAQMLLQKKVRYNTELTQVLCLLLL